MKLSLEVIGIFDWHIKKMRLPPVENNVATTRFRFDDVLEWEKSDQIVKDSIPKFIVTYCPFIFETFKENMEMIGEVRISFV